MCESHCHGNLPKEVEGFDDFEQLQKFEGLGCAQHLGVAVDFDRGVLLALLPLTRMLQNIFPAFAVNATIVPSFQ